jgi:hypothetical protein
MPNEEEVICEVLGLVNKAEMHLMYMLQAETKD